MKKILIFTIALLFVSTNIYAKDVKTEALSALNSDLEKYKVATLETNVDTLMEFVYPTVFTLYPKEKMKKMLKQMADSGKMPKIKKMDFIKINSIQTFKEGSFTTVEYKMEMDMKVGELKPEIKTKMLKMLKAKMGKTGEVLLNEKTNTFMMKKESELIAIKKGSDSWKFIEKEQSLSLSQNKLLPESIIEKLSL